MAKIQRYAAILSYKMFKFILPHCNTQWLHLPELGKVIFNAMNNLEKKFLSYEYDFGLQQQYNPMAMQWEAGKMSWACGADSCGQTFKPTPPKKFNLTQNLIPPPRK